MQKTMIFSCAMAAISVGFAQDTQTQAQAQDMAKKLAAEIQSNIQTGVEENAVVRASGGGNTFVFVGGEMLTGDPVKGQPYSADAVTENTQTLADGNRIVNRSTTNIYRDSEGRERREESIRNLGPYNAQGEPAKVIFISDPVAKLRYTLRPDDHTAERMPVKAMTINFSAREGGAAVTKTVQMTSISTSDPGNIGVGVMRQAISDSPSSAKTEQLAPQMIEGVLAQGTRTTATIPAGQMGNERDITIVNERWVSSELGVVVMSKQSDPRSGERVYKLTNINRNEPQHSLFEVPPDYKVNDAGAMKVFRDQKSSKEEEQ
jgi:hypothetical protein